MTAKKKKAPNNTKNNTKPTSSKSTSGESGEASRLPFEPTSTRHKPLQQAASGAAKGSEAAPSLPTKPKTAAQGASNFSAIPEIVSRRMVRRAALFCGVPSACALMTFIVSYLVIANDIFQPPTAAVLLISLGFFGLGVAGLSYGPLSASWDEERLGHPIGLDEFKLNFGRLRDSWRAAKVAKEE